MPQCNEVDVLINNKRVSEFPESVGTQDERMNVVEHWFHSWRPIVSEDVGVTTACVCVIDNSDIRDFREEVAAIPGVSAVLVETGANDERHITTFVTELSDEIEERVYRAEARVIEKYLNRVFDFHLRLVPRDQQGDPQLPGGPFYLLTWQAR